MNQEAPSSRERWGYLIYKYFIAGLLISVVGLSALLRQSVDITFAIEATVLGGLTGLVASDRHLGFQLFIVLLLLALFLLAAEHFPIYGYDSANETLHSPYLICVPYLMLWIVNFLLLRSMRHFMKPAPTREGL